MARPKKDDKDKKTTVIPPMRVTEEEKAALYSIASNRGIHFSQMILQDYLQKEPTVTFANPERAQLIKAIALLGQVVTFMNGINPKDKAQEEQIESAIQGALLFFNHFQNELNGRNKR